MLEKWQIREVDKMLRLNKISFISFRSENMHVIYRKCPFGCLKCIEKLLLLIYILKTC